MSFFGQPQQNAQPPSMFGGQMPPEVMQMLMQRMQGGGQPPMPPPGGQQQMPQMPPGGMNPVNVPQLPPMQGPMMGAGDPSQMNPLASMLGNAGGAMHQQGQLNNGTAGGGNGMGGLAQILNSLRSAQTVNGTEPQGAPGGMDINALMAAMGGK